MTIHVLPLEPLDKRYTSQWIDWFYNEFQRLEVDYKWYQPSSIGEIQRGQFLDVVDTNAFKASQLKALCMEAALNGIKEKDVIFFFDLWFPGIEMMFYIRDGLPLDFKIAGIFHAGTYDPYDFLTQSGMRTWAASMEKVWCAEVDQIYLSTEFHKELLKPRLSRDNVSVTGLPLMWKTLEPFSKNKKENIIVFPHRLAPEKNPGLFDQLAAQLADDLPGWQFIKTQDKPRTKTEYYDLISRAKVAVSFSNQETWGISMLEALFLKCIPVVPNRLAYPETMPVRFTYSQEIDIPDFVEEAALDYEQIINEKDMVEWRENRIAFYGSAIERMVKDMRQRGWSL